MSEDCLFCKIIKGEIPSKKVFEDDKVYAFRDINPQSPEHILIIPKKHIADMNHAQEEDKELLGHLLLTGKNIAADLGFGTDGYRNVINTGEYGGQEVYHIHLHLLGGRKHSWPPG